MRSTRITALSILAVLCAAFLPATALAGPTADFEVDQPIGSSEDYWTGAKMRQADALPPMTLAGEPQPRSVSVGSPGAGSATYVPPAAPGVGESAEILQGSAGGAVANGRALSEVPDPSTIGIRAHGKVFFTLPKLPEPNDYVCSGTAVNSRNRSAVLTAGHCIFDAQRGGGKATNFLFVPAYRDGVAPYGTFEAKKLKTTKQWKRDSNLRFDLGAAIVRRNEAGLRLQTAVGARGIGFSQPRRQSFDIFGYPREFPFDGEREYLCSTKTRGVDSPGGAGPAAISAKCGMTGGASGGGWLIGGKTIFSVVSYGYRDQPGILYGPYLAATAKKLYKAVRGSK